MSVWGWLAVGLFFAAFIFVVVMGVLLMKDEKSFKKSA